MVKDAESNASADKEKREKIDLKNQAETLVYQTEKQLGELGDKIDAAAKSKVEEKSNALKEATSKEDYESMKKLLEELQQDFMQLVHLFISNQVISHHHLAMPAVLIRVIQAKKVEMM